MAVKLLTPLPTAEAFSDISSLVSGVGAVAELEPHGDAIARRDRLRPDASERRSDHWSIEVAALRVAHSTESEADRTARLEAVTARHAALRAQIAGLKAELRRLSVERGEIKAALQQMLVARERELVRWREREAALHRELEQARGNLGATRAQLTETRLALKIERLAWVRERRGLEGRIDLLRHEADRGWLSRLLRGRPAF